MAHNTQTNKQTTTNINTPENDSLKLSTSIADPSPALVQRDPQLRPGEQSNFIFSESDLKRAEQLRIKILGTPLTFLLCSSLLVFASKKLNLRRLIANPLKDESQFAKNDKYWRFASLNTIVMGTFGFWAFSLYRSQLNKVYLFKKYEKEVGVYMKWRIQTETKEFLKQKL